MATAKILNPTLEPKNSHSERDRKKLDAIFETQVTEVSCSETDGDKLVVSPYSDEPHLLDLKTLDTANQVLAKALVDLKCLREDYATAPYVEIFNWDEVIDTVRKLSVTTNFNWTERSFYIVVFRSRIPPTTVYADLGVLDKAAHAEATLSGGFLKYWFGKPDETGRNLATCVWRSLEDARTGSVGPAHAAAAIAARHLYDEWKIERLRLTINDGVRGFDISNWV